MKKAPARPLKVDLQSLLAQGLTQAEMIFVQSEEEEETFHQDELIQLEVYGLSLNPDPNHPVLLLRDEKAKYVLSVMINPLEAGVTLTQSNKSIAPITPHKFAQELLKTLNIEIVQCVFVQIKGMHQFVRIYLKGHPTVNSLKFRAEEVMSLVLHLGIPIFASRLFIEKSRVLNVQIAGLQMNQVQNKKIDHKNQSYVI